MNSRDLLSCLKTRPWIIWALIGSMLVGLLTVQAAAANGSNVTSAPTYTATHSPTPDCGQFAFPSGPVQATFDGLPRVNETLKNNSSNNTYIKSLTFRWEEYLDANPSQIIADFNYGGVLIATWNSSTSPVSWPLPGQPQSMLSLDAHSSQIFNFDFAHVDPAWPGIVPADSFSLAVILGNGCQVTYTAQPTPTRTATRTRTPTKTYTHTPTVLKTATASRTPTSTSTLTPSYTTTTTPSNTITLTPTRTITLTPTNTVTLTPSNTITITLTPSLTPSLTASLTYTSTPTSTETPPPTDTPTETSTATPVPTDTATQPSTETTTLVTLFPPPTYPPPPATPSPISSLLPTPTGVPTNTYTPSMTPTSEPVVIVTNSLDSGPGSLRQALMDSLPGGVILFDPSLAGQTITLVSTLSVTKNLTVDGSGLNPPPAISGNQAVRIFAINPSTSVTLRSLVLENGYMRDTSYTDYGAAIYADANSTLTIDHVTFQGNNAYQAGAIAASNSGPVSILDSTFNSNSSWNGAGAIYVHTSANLTVQNSTLVNNSSYGGGGAIFFDGGGTDLLENNAFTNNSALSGGAVLVNQNGGLNLTILNNTFSGNSATQTGGAMRIYYNGSPQIVAENNTFYNNRAATFGGAIETEGSLLSENNTFSNNEADASGGNGGASLYLSSTGTTTLYNNIFANSTAGGECSKFGSSYTIGGYNLVDDGSSACLPSLTRNPQLGPLTDNGGPTSTMALLAGSPAIDAGDDASCPATDQRGVPRPQGAHCDLGSYEFGANPPTATATSTLTNTPIETSTPTSSLPPTDTLTPTSTPTPIPTIIVTSPGDSGPGSLRQALTDVVPGGAILFDPSLAGQTITLASTLSVTKNLTIDGSGLNPPPAISGNGAVRIFSISPSTVVTLRSLTLENGYVAGNGVTDSGAAVYADAASFLTIEEVTFQGNNTYQGGAIYVVSSTTVSILDSAFISNSSGNT